MGPYTGETGRITTVPDRSIRAQQASSTRWCEYGGSENVCVYSYCAMLCVVLAVTCIWVIYKFLSLGLWSAERSRQAKLEKSQAKHPCGKQSKRLVSRGGQEDSVCFERGARMDSFTAVLTMPSRSSLYKLSVWARGMIHMHDDYSNCTIMWMTDPISFIRTLKKTIRPIWTYTFVLEIGTVANSYIVTQFLFLAMSQTRVGTKMFF